MPQICRERVQGHTGVRARQPASGAGFPTLGSPLRTQSRADSDPGGLGCGLQTCISNKLPGDVGRGWRRGTTLRTTSQERYFSRLNVHRLPRDAVDCSPEAWVRACTSKQASRPCCSSAVPILFRRGPDSIRPQVVTSSLLITAKAAFLQEDLSTSCCSQILEQDQGVELILQLICRKRN